MTRYLLICSLPFLISVATIGQQRTSRDEMAASFAEIKAVTAQYKGFWDLDLYAPILLVQPETRDLFANYPDTAGVLKSDGPIFTGRLPASVNIANTAMRWNGLHWAMVMLPLPVNKEDRLSLLAHELFHRAQPLLGFRLHNADNNHLDQKDGRIRLRLELEALRAALLAESPAEAKRHLTAALTFRSHRHELYHNADTTENLLELNEGIAEYTGVMMSGRDKKGMLAHFVNGIDAFLKNPTFVRSFAYQTIPLYGYILHGTNSAWNKEITSATDLTQFFRNRFALRLPVDLKSAVASIAGEYNGQTIEAEETAREAEIRKLVAGYKRKFLEEPHLEIALQRMSVSFDPRNIMPLEDEGTVYPTMRVTDEWGILTVTKGALMSPAWNKVSVSVPTHVDDDKAAGDGWTLELKKGFVVQKDTLGSNYRLKKR